MLYLLPQFLQRGEFLFAPETAAELDAYLLPVQVTVKAQQERLHRHGIAVGDGGAGAHVGHAVVHPAVRQVHAGDIHPMGGREHMLRHRQIHRGYADGAPDALTVLHRLAQAVAVPQEFRRPLHVARLHQRADIGGADGDALPLHRRDNVAADAQLGTFFL